MYNINNETYVNNFNLDETYSINKVVIKDNKLTLIPIISNININPNSGYQYNNKTFLYVLEFNPSTYIETAYLYILNNSSLTLVASYAFPFSINSIDVYSNFNDKYLYLNQDNLTIRINLEQLTTEVINTDSSILNLIYDRNNTYIGIWEINETTNQYYVALGEISWK